ncbi:MAG: hypothetical protein KDC98_10955 [Planctomycetes bacterium]|nr:hypothetical protein [Planctomycetota bacterium]
MTRAIPILVACLLGACAANPRVEPGSDDSFGAVANSLVGSPQQGVDAAEYVDREEATFSLGDEAAARGPAGTTADAPAVAVDASSSAPTVDAFGPGAGDAADDLQPHGNESLPNLERSLRDRLAGDDPVDAALELAALLCDLERHGEAVWVLLTARSKVAEPLLEIALASVRRDLGERHLAVAGLRALRRQQGPLALHPAVLFELAELEWLEGDRAGASTTIAELSQLHGDDEWSQKGAAAIAALRREVAEAKAPTRVKVRDLLGNLRGAPSVMVRLRTFEHLLRIARRAESQSPSTAALERRVLAIGLDDDAPAVRARAIQLGPPASDLEDPAILTRFCRLALADADPLVRRTAAPRVVELIGPSATDLLLQAMATESDAAAFSAMHAALASIPGAQQPPAVDAADPESRQRAVMEWRQRWGS